MRTSRCVICSSTDVFGAFSTTISGDRVMICNKCIQFIRLISPENIRDTQYDEFFSCLKGKRDIVINSEPYGKFGLSHKAQIEYLTALGTQYTLVDREDRHATNKYGKYTEVNNDRYWDTRLARDDRILVNIVRNMGDEASGPMATLTIVSIPIDVEWKIESFQGEEWVAEKHRVWF